MKFHLSFEITIDAPVERVWEVLVDFDAYPEWNSAISFKNTPALGKTVPMRVGLEGRKVTTKVTFLRMEKNKELAWVGGIKKMIRGEHYFELEDLGNGTTRLVQGEKFKGLLVPAMWPFLKGILSDFYQENNQEIAAACKKKTA